MRLRHKSEHGATWEVSAYHDHIINPLVQGSGFISDGDAATGDLLIDPVSGAFRTTANTYGGSGIAADALVPVLHDISLSAAIAAGPALANRDREESAEMPVQQAVSLLKPRLTPTVTVGAEGTLQKVGTSWRASYRWQPVQTITAVDPYTSPAGEAYLSILLRQPIRVGRIFPGGTQAVVDMRNLLAQGYCPFVTPDGSTLFFAQADRSIAGGIAFTF